MKKSFTHWKALFAVLLMLSITLGSFAQDWTKERSGLFYYGSKGKVVYMEADFDAMAVYFENDQLSKETEQAFKQKLALEKAGVEKIEAMDLRGMIRIKSGTSVKAFKGLDNRKDFLQTYGLEEEGAYDVLPAFKIGDKQAWFTKRVAIRLNEGVVIEDIAEILEVYDAQYIKNIINSNTHLLKVENIENQLPLIQDLHAMGVLKWGEPDFKVDLVKTTDDPMYPDQWHLNNTGGSIDGKALVADIDVNAPEAWTITTGSSDVIVAVIDDGVEAHEDMQTLLPGYTPVDGSDGAPASSGDGHGQQVAGLISAQHNSIGVAGIAPGVSMFSVNIFAPNTTNTDVAEGIVWAVDNGADVLSNSWGFGSCTYDVAAITDAFAYAASNGRGGLGSISLVASGNDFYDCVSYPANLPTVTAVGGISGDGERSMYSNYGPALDIVAPSDDDWQRFGRDYYSTGTHGLRTIDREGTNGWYDGNYSEAFGGTSGATPQVSAVTALVLSVNSSLTKSEVENILYTSAKDMGDENQYGAGLVDAYGAVTAASGGGGGDEEAPTAPTNLSASNITETSFTLSWTASTDNIGVTGYDVYQDGSIIGTTTNTNYNVDGLSASTTYTYTVKAKDAAGNVSAASNALDVTTATADTEAPTAPTNLASSDITTSSFTLSWTASTDNVEVAGYDVFQDGSIIGSTANTSYNVTGLSASTTYSYTVKAKDAAGNVSAASSALDVTTLAGNTAPIADAGGPYSGDEGTAIAFDGTGSSDADGDALTYNWNFGDGATGTGATPTHTYASSGSYTATLTVSDGIDSDQATASVTVNSTSVDQPMISAISLSTRTSGPWYRVSGTVTITSNGQAVSNAFVEGYWSDGVSGSVSGYTGTDGTLSLEELKSKNTSFTFTITNVTLSGYYWDTANSQTSASTTSQSFGAKTSTSQLPFSVYPNPVTNGALTVTLPEVGNGVEAVIYDINGSARIKQQLTNLVSNIAVENLNAGVYILKVEGQDDPQRIIIK